MRTVLLVLMGAWSMSAAAQTPRYMFYRSMRGRAGDARRVFGGREGAWGAACALLDRYWGTRCSGAVLAPRWALTAAHCVSPRIAYVKYNTRYPSSAEGDAAPVHYLYRHPRYHVLEQDEGRGPDVTELHHDVGLVRTRADMLLAAPPPLPPASALHLYDTQDLHDESVDVLGFGRTERAAQGEELWSARLVVEACGRSGWYQVVCGAGRGGPAAVCAGDSGGPVLYRGAQVAVTSMGPVECVAGPPTAGPPPATSVLTALRSYAALINATVHDADAALRMTRIDPARSRAPAGPSLAALALLARTLREM